MQADGSCRSVLIGICRSRYLSPQTALSIIRGQQPEVCWGGVAMRRRFAVIAVLVNSVLLLALPAQTGGSLVFNVFPLLRPGGSSENAITISGSGQMALTSLSWQEFGTNTWLGPFGSVPPFVG